MGAAFQVVVVVVWFLSASSRGGRLRLWPAVIRSLRVLAISTPPLPLAPRPAATDGDIVTLAERGLPFSQRPLLTQCLPAVPACLQMEASSRGEPPPALFPAPSRSPKPPSRAHFAADGDIVTLVNPRLEREQWRLRRERRRCVWKGPVSALQEALWPVRCSLGPCVLGAGNHGRRNAAVQLRSPAAGLPHNPHLSIPLHRYPSSRAAMAQEQHAAGAAGAAAAVTPATDAMETEEGEGSGALPAAQQQHPAAAAPAAPKSPQAPPPAFELC